MVILLVVIVNYPITSYSIDGYWWLLVPVLLVVINGYFIGNY
jgi:hypothetical protein